MLDNKIGYISIGVYTLVLVGILYTKVSQFRDTSGLLLFVFGVDNEVAFCRL